MQQEFAAKTAECYFITVEDKVIRQADSTSEQDLEQFIVLLKLKSTF